MKTTTRLTAWTVAYFLTRAHYQFNSILNIGVSTAPEYWVWKVLFPKRVVLGIDPRPKRAWWVDPYVACLIGDGENKEVPFCIKCHSIFCKRPTRHAANKWYAPQLFLSLDEVVAREKVLGPYFLWMDIEGSEVAALEGAAQVLKQTGYINVEVTEDRRGKNVQDWLDQHGYVAIHKSLYDKDVLYCKRKV